MPEIILGIESSCDDTSAAVIKDGYLLSNVLASQDVHKSYGGVIPELASRAHQVNIVPVVSEAITRAGISPEDISIKVEDGDRMSYPTLRISGSTKIEAIDFENAVDLSITLNCKEDISGIDYNVKDGLTIIHLIVKERESKYNDMIKFNENLKV